ncbi:hypothetical protein [Anaerocellum danielii]|uniref:Uncharacterized protein n=1 Tax=Anaerocellum danielii TaxID=1387557 RepID=A0ABZ0U0L0_9FIRM|nr:hypothetical protein [Caldicellulosiruptor danielii]WPX09252.1 hypothetical protein SOJ16_000446 [Caldicellulosiruptor danielii]
MKVGQTIGLNKNEKNRNENEFTVTFSKEHDLDLYFAINNANLYFKKESENTISIWLYDTYTFDNHVKEQNSIEQLLDLIKGKMSFGEWLNEFGQDLQNMGVVNSYEIHVKIETVKVNILL